MSRMPAQETLVSVEEYLNTSYEGPDREYVDGRIVERNVGETGRGRLERKLTVFFAALESSLKTYGYPETRVQVKLRRFRIPDISVCLGAEVYEPIIRSAPFLAIEILSKDDRASDLEEKLQDYREFEIPYIWVIDPRTRSGVTYSLSAPPQTGLHAKNPDIDLPVERLFED